MFGHSASVLSKIKKRAVIPGEVTELAEGARLEIVCGVNNSTKGSNPFLSAVLNRRLSIENRRFWRGAGVWLNGTVSKTVVAFGHRGFKSLPLRSFN